MKGKGNFSMNVCYVIGLMFNILYLLYSHIIFVESLLNPLMFLISTFINFVLKVNMRCFLDWRLALTTCNNNHIGSPCALLPL